MNIFGKKGDGGDPPEEWTSTQTGNTSKNSALLRDNLGLDDNDGQAAHHIVASTHRLAKPARNILDKYHIDINSSVNGIALVGGKGSAIDVKPRHHRGNGLHSFRGILKVVERIKKAEKLSIKKWGKTKKVWDKNRDAVLEELSLLKQEISNGTFP